MRQTTASAPIVGVLANPASGRDVRRVVAQASVFQTAEKCNMVQRALAALGSVGVRQVLMMPDRGGIAAAIRRAIEAHGASPSQPWPEVGFLDLPIEGGPVDTVLAVEAMVRMGARVIIVLGGDGTHRLVATASGDTPLVSLSTGTNNAFPEIREATVAGLAAGLVAIGAVAPAAASVRNKVLRVSVNGQGAGIALVDVCVTTDRWVGAKAVWKPESLRELFVTFAKADAIGLSAIPGLLRPVDRREPHGLRVSLLPPGEAATTLHVPIAPGLIAEVGIAETQVLRPNEKIRLATRTGVVALDGERELEFGGAAEISVWLELNGPVTIDVEAVMRIAASQRLFSFAPSPTRGKAGTEASTAPHPKALL